MKLSPKCSTPDRNRSDEIHEISRIANERKEENKQGQHGHIPVASRRAKEECHIDNNNDSLLFPTLIPNEANIHRSKQKVPSRPKTKYRPSKKMPSSSDPMIQTISGVAYNTPTDLPDYLSLSLTDATTSTLDLSDSSQHKQPKLHRRRSRNKLVEAIVSKAVESLAKGYKESPPRDSSYHLHRKLSPKVESAALKSDLCGSSISSNVNIDLNSSSGEFKRKTPRRGLNRRNRKRSSDTGILGQIGYWSPSQNDRKFSSNKANQNDRGERESLNSDSSYSYQQSPPFPTNTVYEEREENSFAVDDRSSSKDEIYTPSPSSHSGQESSGYLDNEGNDTSDSPIFAKIDDSSYDETIDTGSSGDDDSAKIVPERLWNGSILLPNGKISTEEFLHSDDEKSGYISEEQESIETNYEEYDNSKIDDSLESRTGQEYDTDTSKNEERRQTLRQDAYNEHNRDDTILSDDMENSQTYVEFNKNDSIEEVVAEIIDIDDTTSEYSTDTDHESGEELQPTCDTPTASVSKAIPPISSTQLKSRNNSYQLEKNQKLALPRFKINPLSSPEPRIKSSLSTTPLSSITSSSKSFISTISKHEYVKPKKWSLGSQIGAGSFGVVHVGMNDLTGNLMAVKVLKNIVSETNNKNDGIIMKDLQREIDLMRKLSHPNIVRYFGAERKKNSLYIFQEWVPGGSLSSLLRKFGSFSLPVVRRYLYQILQGLGYLHSNHILHRDIKGGNILVDDRGTIKLADFGASKEMFPGSSLGESNSIMMQSMTIKGTPYFMAPEVFEQKYNKKADIWSVGGVILQMITGQPPWKTLGFQSPMSLFYHLKSTAGPPPIDTDIPSKSLRKIVESCFERDAGKRLGVRELLQEDFFGENEDEDDDENCSTASESNIESLDCGGIGNSYALPEQYRQKSQSKKNDHAYANAMKNITNVNENDLQTIKQKQTRKGKKFSSKSQRKDDCVKEEDISAITNDTNTISDDWPAWAKQNSSATSSVQNIFTSVPNKLETKRPNNPFQRQNRTKSVDQELLSISMLKIDDDLK